MCSIKRVFQTITHLMIPRKQMPQKKREATFSRCAIVHSDKNPNTYFSTSNALGHSSSIVQKGFMTHRICHTQTHGLWRGESVHRSWRVSRTSFIFVQLLRQVNMCDVNMVSIKTRVRALCSLTDDVFVPFRVYAAIRFFFYEQIDKTTYAFLGVFGTAGLGRNDSEWQFLLCVEWSCDRKLIMGILFASSWKLLYGCLDLHLTSKV